MYKILLVDDKEIFCRYVMRMPYFKENSDKFYITWIAHNGAEAADILKREKVDLTLTDIKMPVMDGIELLNYIQERQLCPVTILLSEYIEFSYAKNAFLNGAFDYLVKPLDNNLLTMVLNDAYTFLNQSKGNSVDIFHGSNEILNFILNNDEEALNNKISESKNIIKSGQLSDDAVLKEAKELLIKLYTDINLKFPYVKNYIPLDFVCDIEKDCKESEEILESLRLKLILLFRKLKFFKAPTENSLIKNVWYYSIYNIDENPKLMDVAASFFVNRNYLSGLFKTETKMSYKEFISKMKIERSKKLISASECSIAECSEMLGFSDAEYFRKVFKSITGITPGRYSIESYISGK